MIGVIPAVDVLDGQAVRLRRGDYGDVTLRRGDPAGVVGELVAAGATLVHVVDLDGALRGALSPVLFARLAEAAAPARIQASGGIRSVADAEALLAAGAARVLVGTAALTDPGPEAFAEALGGRLVVALDVRSGLVAIRGWTEGTAEGAEAAAERCARAGVARLHCTAVERDGTLAGPDLALLRRVVEASGLPVVAAGGIAALEDLRAVAAAGCEAAVVGRALLDGTLPRSVLGNGERPTAAGPLAFARSSSRLPRQPHAVDALLSSRARPSGDGLMASLRAPTYAPRMARADVTRRGELDELRERVAELERERELLNAIANTAPSLLCLIDPDGTVRPYATNKAFERRLGYRPEDTGGVRFWERYVPPDDAAPVRDAIEAVVAGGEPVLQDGRWLTRRGDVVHVEWSCSPLPMIASGPLFLLSAADVTERKRHEAEVRRSRARIVAAADEARKRLERNLHDGAQQRLVAVMLALRLARARVSPDPEAARSLDAAIAELGAAVDELRELARGIHPAALTERGLATAVRGVAHRAPVPVELDVTDVRYPEPVEAAAYFVVSESLANVARYARASAVAVRIGEAGGMLAVEVEDDGVGGADEGAGTGLRGLSDRVAALDGSFAVESPPGGGTRVRAEIPLP